MGTRECLFVAVAIAAVVATSGADFGLEDAPAEDLVRGEEKHGEGLIKQEPSVETVDGNTQEAVQVDDSLPEEVEADLSEAHTGSSEAASTDSPAPAEEQAENHSGEIVPVTDHEMIEGESQENSHVGDGETHEKTPETDLPEDTTVAASTEEPTLEQLLLALKQAADARRSLSATGPTAKTAAKSKPVKPLTLEEFEARVSRLRLAEPVLVRRHFHVHNEEADRVAIASRKVAFAVAHQLTVPTCPVRFPPKCDSSVRYRSSDGSCNNVKHPFWGSAAHWLNRFLPPAYEDGKMLPRGARYSFSDGYTTRLPNPRKISVKFHTSKNVSDHAKHTHMFMQFAQFVDHDVVAVHNFDFDCCSEESRKLCVCFPVDLKGDAFFSRLNKTCMPLSRASFNCRADKRWLEHINAVSAFLDLSPIYGCSAATAAALRGKKDSAETDFGGMGKLQVNPHLSDFNIPTQSQLNIAPRVHGRSEDFFTGDGRSTSQPLLLSLHNVMLNAHNDVAEALGKALEGRLGRMDAAARDEVVFQEARRIMTAQYQHIVYTQFLPGLVGMNALAEHDAVCRPDSTYRQDVDASVTNAFAGAAFRFGHSVVQDVFNGRGQPWRLSNGMGDPMFAVKDNGKGFENEIAGSIGQTMLACDRFMSADLTNGLFANAKLLGKGKASLFGVDLAATNIQRGRDMGVPGYNAFRRLAGLAPIESMQQRPDQIDEDNWRLLEAIYKHPDDIDLFTGGLAEMHNREDEGSGMLGPTFTWIIAEQFKLLRSGDRFFFTHTKGPGAAGLPSHLQRMIMKRTLGDILCETVSSLGHVQRNVFVAPDAERNPVMHCKHPNRARLDFDAIAKNLLEELKISQRKPENEGSMVQPQEADEEMYKSGTESKPEKGESIVQPQEAEEMLTSVTEKSDEVPELKEPNENVEENEQPTETAQSNEETSQIQDMNDASSAVEESSQNEEKDTPEGNNEESSSLQHADVDRESLTQEIIPTNPDESELATS